MNRLINKTLGFFRLLPFGAAACALALAGCAQLHNTHTPVLEQPFGITSDGQPVDIYMLRNSSGCEARILNYGGIVVSLKVPDKNGKLGDVVLGHDEFGPYQAGGYMGAIIGRYCGRIAHGKFTLDGHTCTLPLNSGSNTLHGGPKGFNRVIWNVKRIESGRDPALELTYLSKDGEDGFPGNLQVTAVYTLTGDNALRLDLTATTDKPTVCNLTQHPFFNLAGGGDILDHEVMIKADQFTPQDSAQIPTGEIRSVKGTPFDFTTPIKIGARIHDANEELKFEGGGYDENFVLNKKPGKLALAARVTEKTSGRVMEVFTTEPGLQFYSGNALNMPGRSGVRYHAYSGFAMEPQHFPDSPNHPNFPSTVLRPGQVYHNTIIYRFSVE